MKKHVSFWIGFFTSSLLIVPIAVGIWGTSEEWISSLATLAVGAICTLVFLIIIILFFREPILKRVTGQTEASLEETVNSLIGLFSATLSKDRFEAEQQASKFAGTLVGWYAWSSFYRWVLSSALALLLAFGAFTGTVLLFEQNRKIEVQTGQLSAQTEQANLQNEIMTLSLVRELREQLISTINPPSQLKHLTMLERGHYSKDQQNCSLNLSGDPRLQSPASDSIIGAIVDIGTGGRLSSQVKQALEHLVSDSDQAVAFSAFLALDRLGATDALGDSVRFSNLKLSDVYINSEIRIELFDSHVTLLDCASCELFLLRSYADGVEGTKLDNQWSYSAWDGHVQSDDVTSLLTQIPDDAEAFRADILHFSNTSDADFRPSIFIRASSRFEEDDHCSMLGEFGRLNPFFNFVAE